MLLNEAQRERLTKIEQACLSLEATVETITQLNKRAGKLKSKKFLDPVLAALSVSQRSKLELEQFVQTATADLFDDAFGIYVDGIVSVQRANGTLEEPLVVNQLRARQLSDGSAVFFIAGNSFQRNIVGSKPLPVMYRVTEQDDDSFQVDV